MQQSLFDLGSKITTINDISNPDTYKGIFAFHKYWGKKPIESIAYFIQNFTNETDIVLDPFVGSGLISRECLSTNRRFIGIDLNPVAIELTKFILNPPNASDFKLAINQIDKRVKNQINQTYTIADGKIASHYLWKNNNLQQVWIKNGNARKRVELEPTDFDQEQKKRYDNYSIRNIRKPTFFTNSRINANTKLSIYDLFTHRALHNMDLLLDEIKTFPDILQRALVLTLTSASGQMSSMVFAITNRGKAKNNVSNKIEVGSWVIGFWRPELHFEINVWNCFESRANKLYKALADIDERKFIIHDSIYTLFKSNQGASIQNADCLEIMKEIPEKSIKLICTDPPHSDRIPYLELSEIWNSILNKDVAFDKEIIVTNAKERNKKKIEYIKNMELFINESNRILTDDGILLIYFNARDNQSWKFMEIIESKNDLEFIGSFPMEYSANSVVQDNRRGGMKTDYVLVLTRKGNILHFKDEITKIPGWTKSIPLGV